MSLSTFKGLALFTPGGDVIYCIAPDKQEFWHVHLCMKLQEVLGLSEAPHFLIPGYTATVDRYFDTKNNEIKTLAEVHPLVERYQPLLNVIFDLADFQWQTVNWQEELCSPLVFAHYREQFPVLWENHNLIVGFDLAQLEEDKYKLSSINRNNNSELNFSKNFYLFYLFITEYHQDNYDIFKSVHFFLENNLQNSYTLKIIDIVKNPELAETYHISATPTLLKVLPKPLKRIVGQLDNISKILEIINN